MKINIYCSIYRKKEFNILTCLPQLTIYSKQHAIYSKQHAIYGEQLNNHNNLIIEKVNVEQDMMFYLRMIRGNCINFESLYLLVKYYSKKNDNLEILLNCSANINIRDINGQTLLIKVSMSGPGTMISELIEARSSVDFWNDCSYSERLQTHYIENTKIAKKLINARCALDIQDNNQYTALIGASYNGNTELVRVLVDAKCMLDILNNYQSTALIVASEFGSTEIVDILIGAGCLLNILNNDQDTALSLAVYEGHTEIVRKLIYARCKVNLSNKFGKTALDYATKGSGYQQIIDLLMAAENLRLAAKN